MTDEIIIQQLRDKEERLLNELNKVRLALKAFVDENMGFVGANQYNRMINDLMPQTYTSGLTYGSKILFVLHQEGRPMLVDDITDAIHALEPELELTKLHKNVGHNLSMLAKYSKVRKHPFNRKIKYSL